MAEGTPQVAEGWTDLEEEEEGERVGALVGWPDSSVEGWWAGAWVLESEDSAGWVGLTAATVAVG